jgi:hypothetical protein
MTAILLVLFAGLGSACSLTTGGGRTFNFGQPLQQVLVTNNSRTPCLLSRNGEDRGPLYVGDTAQVLFPSLSNMVIGCKAFTEVDGEKKYIGYTSQVFYPGYDSFEKREWVITYFQRPQVY